MAKKTRKTVHVTVELDTDVLASDKEIRAFVKRAVDKERSELPQFMPLASTPPVTILSCKEIK
jgi:hypothetical protein